VFVCTFSRSVHVRKSINKSATQYALRARDGHRPRRRAIALAPAAARAIAKLVLRGKGPQGRGEESAGGGEAAAAAGGGGGGGAADGADGLRVWVWVLCLVYRQKEGLSIHPVILTCTDPSRFRLSPSIICSGSHSCVTLLNRRADPAAGPPMDADTRVLSALGAALSWRPRMVPICHPLSSSSSAASAGGGSLVVVAWACGGAGGFGALASVALAVAGAGGCIVVVMEGDGCE
jgi:hypothetical protein